MGLVGKFEMLHEIVELRSLSESARPIDPDPEQSYWR